MSSKAPAAVSSAIHPPLGTRIDGDSLELVEVLGVGGYGIAYRAVETRSLSAPKSYAVKCLVANGHQSARQRQIHIREVALHRIASAHPGVVTLHKIVESYSHTYIIMEYAPDHDLFTQILHSCRYLGDDALIKHVFLQLLDAVEYIHSLGIYHRDLKPENILCFDDGFRIAITDFGLATTDKYSDEFRTGSVYHMSPECQGGEFAPDGYYSPIANDIWSLGIILLNLATGRNPWKSATLDDPTFQAYLRDPVAFLPSVLPISAEVNDILVRMLDIDWQQRMSIPEVRRAIEEVYTFYSDGVIFEGSMARCPWEAGMEIDSDSSENTQEEQPLPESPSPRQEADTTGLKSRWSKDTTSDIIFATHSLGQESSYGAPWTTYSSAGATWAYQSSSSGSDHHPDTDMYDRTSTPSSIQSPSASLPATPDPQDVDFRPKIKSPLAGLTINTNISHPRFHEAHANSAVSFSTASAMHTAIEYDPYSSLYYLSSQESQSTKGVVVVPDPVASVVPGDKEMTSPSVWLAATTTQASTDSLYSTSSAASAADNTDILFSRSGSPSPSGSWSGCRSQVQCSPPQSQPSPHVSSVMTNVTPSRPTLFSSRKSHDVKSKASSLFTIKFFPRSPPSAPVPSPPSAPLSCGRHAIELDQSFTYDQAPSEAFVETACWGGISSQMAATSSKPATQGRSTRRAAYRRSPRNWFIPGRFFASTGAA